MGVSLLAKIGKALGDRTRVRILVALAAGELCLCQIVDLFGLAPSTLSRHLTRLAAAGLVTCRSQGRWRYFRLAGTDASGEVRRVLYWVRSVSGDDPVVTRDATRLRRIRSKNPGERSACYRN